MSGEVLRRAAALMRENTEFTSPSPWHVTDDNRVWDRDEDLVVASDVDIVDRDLDHIASWHPAVALAVADWLDSVAALPSIEPYFGPHIVGPLSDMAKQALSVALAYLGEQA